MVNVDEILELVRDKSDTKTYLVIIYTGDAKLGKSMVIDEETHEKVPAITFDIVGPVSDPNFDALRILNVCEQYNKIAVVRTVQGAHKKFSIFPSYAAWYAERPKKPCR